VYRSFSTRSLQHRVSWLIPIVPIVLKLGCRKTAFSPLRSVLFTGFFASRRFSN